MDSIPPSLPLLLAKTAAVFIACWFTGWAIFGRPAGNDTLISWIIQIVLGTAVLYLSVVLSSMAGLSGCYGLLVPLGLVGIRMYRALRNRPRHAISRPVREPRLFVAFTAISALAVGSYLAPFLVERTSGFYSRGGGDHSTYLSISDWLCHHPFWMHYTEEETQPPKPYDFVKNFVRKRQEFGWHRIQPLSNQYIATPFMAISPGSTEETYTAVVAFYVALAGWSIVCLLGVLANAQLKQLLLSASLVLLSNLTVYTGTTHSIPMLVAITFLNCALANYILLIRSNQWELSVSSLAPHVVLGGALFLVYPQLFVILLVLQAILLWTLAEKINWRDLIRYHVAFAVAVLLLSNILLLINIPLVLAAPMMMTGTTYAYDWIQLLVTQTGVVDFGLFVNDSRGAVELWSILGGVCLLLLLGFAAAYFRSLSARTKWSVSLICLLFFGAILFYGLEGLSYQVVRFTEVGHLWLLGLGALGIARAIDHERKNLRTFAVLTGVVVLICLGSIRAFGVSDVLAQPQSSQVEFRDAEQLKMISVLQKEQAIATESNTNRVVYYCGPGFGVDHAGSTVLFRSISYFAAHGFSYDSFLGGIAGTPIWAPKWLENSILVVSSALEPDIIADNRAATSIEPRWTFSSLKVYDTRDQPVARVIGDAWNLPQAYMTSDGSPRHYRYLMGKTGAIVIWSASTDSVDLRLTLHADRDSAKAKIEGIPLQKEVVREVRKWGATFDNQDSLSVSLLLKRGPNVILMSPQSNDRQAPWLLVWELEIQPKNR